MAKERDYLTLDEVEEYTGIKKNSLYYYLKVLDIKTHKFTLDRRAYISLEDANRIKEVKDTPWLVGEKPSQKAEKQPDSAPVVPTTKAVVEKPSKRAITQKKKVVGLPAGCITATEFARDHGREPRTFYDDMTKGLGPGLIGESTDTIPERDRVAHETRPKPGRPHETERYLTQEQQLGTLKFWQRHNVTFTECNRFDCYCHETLQKDI